jgi:predicted amidophosphoribosyltransferase
LPVTGEWRRAARKRVASLLRSVTAEIRLLREFLPAANPDLSPPAVSRWNAFDGPICPRCGAFTGSCSPGARGFPCRSCIEIPPPFDAARSLFPYAGDVRDAIVASKYAGRPFPAHSTAERIRAALAGAWKDLIPDGSKPTVVPVPVRPWKYFRRGFNLPALVGSHLARGTGFPFDPLVLSRTREGTPQASLSLQDRRENVTGAFRLPPGSSSPARVLLLDDVYTSGATVREAACALKTGGADHIVVVTVARAVP